MLTDLIQVGITTLASGTLAALGSYIAVIWRLNARVARLEESVTSIEKTAEELKKAQNDRDKTLRDSIRDEFRKDFEHIKEDAKAASVSIQAAARTLEETRKEIIITVGALRNEISDFKVSCAENRAKLVSDKRWAEYTKEQAQKWEDFNRMLGSLEGAITRLSIAPSPLSAVARSRLK